MPISWWMSGRGQTTKGTVTGYEYQVLVDPTGSPEGMKMLNKLGSEGWEIVALTDRPDNPTIFYLKRARRM